MYWGRGRQDNKIQSLSAGKQNSYFVNSRQWAGEWGLELFVLRGSVICWDVGVMTAMGFEDAQREGAGTPLGCELFMQKERKETAG